MIHPLFFYCYPVFGIMSNTWIKKFESLTNRARVIIKYHRNLPSFQTSLKRKIALDAFKALHNIKPNDKYEKINHIYDTKRNKNTFRLPRVRLNAGGKLSYYQGALVFNGLESYPHILKGISVLQCICPKDQSVPFKYS